MTDGHRSRPLASTLDLELGTDEAARVIRALGSEGRVAIMNLLRDRTLNVTEIADALQATMSATSENIKVLSDAGLITTEMIPGSRGLQKACGRAVDAVLITLPEPSGPDGRLLEVSMPVGGFAGFDVRPTCGLLSSMGPIGLFDDPRSFYEPERADAQLLWFHHGYVEYKFPNRLRRRDRVLSVQLSMEICSEAPLHNDSWPSDIEVSVNGHPLGIWTSPGDFGGQPGVYTPEWWSTANSQFGLMKVWQVTDAGCSIDGVRLSDIVLDDLELHDHEFVSVRIAVPVDAQNVGGVNLFGAKFGNYPQDIVLRIQCADANR